MKSYFRRPMLFALFVSALTAVTVIAMEPIYAQYGTPAPRAAAPKAAKQQDKGATARREVATPINDALKLVEMKDWNGALAKVQLADQVKDKTPYEEYMVAKYTGFIAINKEPQDLKAAQDAYNRQIASGGAPEMEKGLMFAAAMRLNYAGMDYAKVISNAGELSKVQPLDDTLNEVLVQAYYNTMDFQNAAKTAKAAADAKTAAGQKASAAILGLLLNSQAKLKDDAGYRVTLDQLATVSAQPEVWGQVMDFALDAVSKGPKETQEHQLLNVFRLGMLVGTMRAEDYDAMASIDLTSGLPNEAKAVLTKGNRAAAQATLMTQTNQMLANDQGSLAGLAAEAGKQMNGEIDVKLGESYMTYGRHDEAVAAIKKGIEKGGLKDAADAQTTLGIALHAAGKREEALAEFKKAEMSNSPAGTVAHVWALFLQRPAA